ncbi:hypothetical protein HY500_01360 [Candidatus Woesearchaeota archaeon]|nr:hypothetical protein [Candidatus Woesearchaeota archaeon]
MVKKVQIKKLKAIHSPNLNTILMVEDILKESGELITVADLKKKLPKKVMHQTLLNILNYLQLSEKIVIGTKGILWIFAERKELKELTKKESDIEKGLFLP